MTVLQGRRIREVIDTLTNARILLDNLMYSEPIVMIGTVLSTLMTLNVTIIKPIMGKRGCSTILKPEPLNLKGAMDFTIRKLKGDRPQSNFLGVLLGEYRLLIYYNYERSILFV